jgi:hypothetical protein
MSRVIRFEAEVVEALGVSVASVILAPEVTV